MITDLLALALSHPVFAGVIIVAAFVVASGDARRILILLAPNGARSPRITWGRK